MEPYGALPAAPFAPGTPDALGYLSDSGHAWSYDASVEIDPVKGLPLTIAVDYKNQGVQNLSGSASFSSVPPIFLAGPLPPPLAALTPIQAVVTSTHVNHQLTIPNELNVGIAYRVVKPLLLTFAYTWDRWVVYGSDTFVSNTGASIVVPRDYSNGNTYRIGGEWLVMPAFELRAGVQRDVSGLKTSTYSPTLPDSSSWGGSLGATVRFSHGLSVNGAFFYAHLDKVTSTNNGLEPGIFPGPTVLPEPQPGTTFRGSYQPWAIVYSLSVGWTPGAGTRG
jgi:long-chain fatty acid transport protein